LLPFTLSFSQQGPEGIPMVFSDYLELADWTGRAIRTDKRRGSSEKASPILERIGLKQRQWLRLTAQFERCFSTFAGREDKIRNACSLLGYRRPPAIQQIRGLTG
jgi:hypothetical protein